MMEKQKSLSIEKDRPDDQCYVRNSSFLSRDIEAQKTKESHSASKDSPPKTASPPIKAMSPPMKVMSPPRKAVSPPRNVVSPPRNVVSPPKREMSLPKKVASPPPVSLPKRGVTSPPSTAFKVNRTDSKSEENSVVMKASKIESASPPKEATPPVSSFKVNKGNSKAEENTTVKVTKRENSIGKETPVKVEKLSLVADSAAAADHPAGDTGSDKVEERDKSCNNEESNGVGDKIKKFEKAAEDAGSGPGPGAGRQARAGSLRGRARPERLGSDGRDEFPPPATPFKDNVHFELGDAPGGHQLARNPTKWQRSDSREDKIQKPEPQKIIKPEFKPTPSPGDATIRSPSLGARAPDRFPSPGTAFRNVASPPDQARADSHKFNDDVNTLNNFKTCKFKTKEKYSVSKGSSYFTRGSEEIWLVKKKDIEEIEERVLDSFRRAGGNVCVRSEAARPASDGGQGAAFAHATMGRSKRQMYARSESLDPQWAGARAQTLKRQTSVACTCGHDKKVRARSAAPAGAPAAPAAAPAEAAPRARSRSHGDDTSAHVLDKYETLV